MSFNREQLIRHVGWKTHQDSGCNCGMEDMVPAEHLRYAQIAMEVIEQRARDDERSRIADDMARWARAILEARNPGMLDQHFPSLWITSSLRTHREAFATVLNAVEADILQSERNRIANLIRGCLEAPSADVAYTMLTDLANAIEKGCTS
ncbi:MAG TPA: hypothetical protein VFY84_19290 [Jiangellales bacterium]|nr:hypothetical protein [Jiangellales bacterium]